MLSDDKKLARLKKVNEIFKKAMSILHIKYPPKTKGGCAILKIYAFEK